MYELYNTYNITRPEYDEEEYALNYKPGGYHPVAIGDEFKHGRYVVKHKLGFGGSSTVWLARDTHNDRNVALKILTAAWDTAPTELAYLNTVKAEPDLFVCLLDHFKFDGPNGNHECLVTEVLGPNLGLLRKNPFLLSPCAVKRVTIKMLTALAWLHDHDIVHGDPNPLNLAFSSEELATMGDSEVMRLLGPVQELPMIRKDGQPLSPHMPKNIIVSAEWFARDVCEWDARVLDLGNAFPASTRPTKIQQNPDFQSPERYFEVPFGDKHDCWIAGIVIYYLVDLVVATEGCFGNEASDVRSLIEFTGGVPLVWKETYQRLWQEKVDAQWREQAQRRLTSPNEWDKLNRDIWPRDNIFEQGPREDFIKPYGFFDRFPDQEFGRAMLDVAEKLTRMLPEDRLSSAEALRIIESITPKQDTAAKHKKFKDTSAAETESESESSSDDEESDSDDDESDTDDDESDSDDNESDQHVDKRRKTH